MHMGTHGPHMGVNAQYDDSILAKITFPINPYNIFLNDSNGPGCYFLKCYYYNI